MIESRLNELRQLLDTYKFTGYMVPSTDEYLSEYVPFYAKRLEYVTGFTGSNGLAIILKNTVLFFTDGRYINQCVSQLDNTLFQVFNLQVLKNFDWSKYIDSDAIISYDAKLFTEQTLQKFVTVNIQAHKENLIDLIWHEQPKKPNSKIYDYPVKYAGEDYKDKIKKCRNFLENNSANNMVINDSDSLCWLLNIRAHDVEFSPLLLANIIITQKRIYCFFDINRIDSALVRDGMVVLPEEEFANVVANLQGVTLFDDNQCSSYVHNLIILKEHKNIKNPCGLWKACKNDVEIKYMQQGHVQDAVAVCEFLSYIAQQDISDLTEYDLSKKLTELREKGELYVFDSFPTICGYKDNGAIIHYRATKESAKKIIGQGLLLIDSGGQYLGATTDITRTVTVGTPTVEHKRYYTKVLKGHIALARAVFPQDKVTGAHLDILARQYLWNQGDDYAHGTGHGVGSFLSVHEGPQNISLNGFGSKIAKGMIMSNEPGYYVPGEFGIRIENMMYVKNAESPGFLCFQMLTLVPYSKELIDMNMLTHDEMQYLKSYYSDIEQKLAPLLSVNALKWLKEQILI
jgi:Xaa-Pro aminopeptidase